MKYFPPSMSEARANWLWLLAAHALPHLPLPPFGADFEYSEDIARSGKRYLMWWAAEIVALLVAVLVSCYAGCQLTAIILVVATLIIILMGTLKLRAIAILARAAGYSPEHL